MSVTVKLHSLGHALRNKKNKNRSHFKNKRKKSCVVISHNFFFKKNSKPVSYGEFAKDVWCLVAETRQIA